MAVAVLLLAAGLAVWQIPQMLDWNRYRAAIESVVAAGLGRPVRIAGPIRLSLLPQATLIAGDVFIGDTGDGAAATVGELRLRVALSPLLTGRVEPQDLVLHGAIMRLPWPLAGFTLLGTAVPAGLHARLEDGTLRIGGLAIEAISGDLMAAADTALSASGLATVLGRPWRMTGRLGRAGADGTATLEVSLDGLDAGVGTGGAFTGQVAADGNVSGRIAARGPDLSTLLPAPAQAWSADGRLAAGSGLLVADDLALSIGGSPARGAVALRLVPALRLDGALATNRLDLDAWLPPLLHGGTVALPTGIDLSAEAAPLAGGTVRRLRAGFDLAGDTVAIREFSAVLPGDAALRVSGRLAGGQFAGSVDVAAPDVPQTLAWLAPRAPALIGALPAGAVRTAHLAATVQASGERIAFGGLAGDVDGVPVTGNLALRPGVRPALSADLQLTGPVLDRWLPALPTDPPQWAGWLAALPARFAGVDADLNLTAARPVWHGTVLTQLGVEGATQGGVLTLRRATLTGPGVTATLQGVADASGRISDGVVRLQTDRAEAAARVLPQAWDTLRPLVRGPATLDVTLSGPPTAWATTAQLGLSDARVSATGQWNAPAGRWTGSMTLRHPGAPRLLGTLGFPGLAAWLGSGSLSAVTKVDATADRVALTGLQVSAGALRSSGDLVLARPAGARPMLTGSLAVDTLPVLLPAVRSAEALPLPVLRTIDARVSVTAAHVLWDAAAAGDAASTELTLDGGVLRLSDIHAHLAGGSLTGTLVVDAAATPSVTATMALKDAVLDGPLVSGPAGIASGVADMDFDVTASGFSPAALLASLRGPVRIAVRDGVLAGLDTVRLLSLLQGAPEAGVGPLQPRVAASLQEGTTAFTQLTAAGVLDGGLLALTDGLIVTSAATIGVGGRLDLPAGALDLDLAVRPALDGAPVIGLRLIGPVAAPIRTPVLADLARWLATRG